MGDLFMCLTIFSQISQMRVCSFPNGGKRWAVQLPQLALWIGPGGDAALFESRSPPWEGGLRGQGVRWNVPTSIPGPTLRRVPRECPLPIPTNPLPPPVRLPFPPQTQ